MKLTALSIALVAALGVTTGCSTQSTVSQASRPAVSLTDAEAQYALGRYYQGQERYEQAIASYRRALAANPAHAGAHNGLGASLLLTGRNAEAIEQFKTGLKQHPRSAALWNNLGYAYALGGENKLAEMAYKQSLDLDPTDYKTNTNLAAVQQAAPPATAIATPAPVMAPIAAAKLEAAQTVAAPANIVPAVATQAAAVSDAAPASPASLVLAKAETPATATAPVQAPPVEVVRAVAAPAIEPAKSATPANTTVKIQSSKAEAPATATAPAQAAPVADPVQAKTSPIETAPAAPANPTVNLQPSVELAGAGPATAATTVQVAQVAPHVYELNLAATSPAVATAATTSVPVYGTKNITLPLREDVIKLAAASSDDFVLEIRNGNGVRRMAWRTSQYLAGQGYTTKRLTNQRGFNVQITRVFYLPGYLAEAEKLLTHLPKDTVLTETTNMRRGIHVRVVLGKDMVQQQAAWEASPEKTHLASL